MAFNIKNALQSFFDRQFVAEFLGTFILIVSSLLFLKKAQQFQLIFTTLKCLSPFLGPTFYQDSVPAVWG